MSSNTTKGRGNKGSKFWMQTLVKINSGNELSAAIRKVDGSVGDTNWLSPLKENDYSELKAKKIKEIETADYSFWPENGPWWDSVGIDEHGTILLVEAKGHVAETESKCKASSDESRQKIKLALKETHNYLVSSLNVHHEFNEDIWLNKYYQLGNRLAFLVSLRNQGYNIKLILLNIVDDPTHIATSHYEWQQHYNEVFKLMLGTAKQPDNLLIVNYEV